MIQVEKISKAFGNRIIFSDVSFHIGKGDRCAVVGRNGSGKSTLLKMISGVEEAESDYPEQLSCLKIYLKSSIE